MSSLVVVAYPSLYQAEEVRLHLLKMQKEYLVDLEDAVIAVRKQDGKVKLHQLYNLTATGAVGGSFWGLLIGLVFLNPLLGIAVGAGAGAVSGAPSLKAARRRASSSWDRDVWITVPPVPRSSSSALSSVMSRNRMNSRECPG